MFDLENISLKNKKAWSLIQSGNTCGVFQLESELGKQWAKTIRPSNINELSALLALIRPACLESGMTSQYSRIKNGKEPPFKFGDKDVQLNRIVDPFGTGATDGGSSKFTSNFTSDLTGVGDVEGEFAVCFLLNKLGKLFHVFCECPALPPKGDIPFRRGVYFRDRKTQECG